MASDLPLQVDFEDAKESRARWSVEQEDVFVDLMEEQVLASSRWTYKFSRVAWKSIRLEFYKRTGMKYSMKQIKNKCSIFRLRYQTFTHLKTIPPGFGWDPILNTAKAPDAVWKSYAKDHPEAKRFRAAGCPKYDKLVTIFGDITATGKEAHASTQYNSDTDDKTEDTSVPLNPETDDVHLDVEELFKQQQKHGRSTNVTSSTSRRAKKRSLCMASDISDAIKSLAEASYAKTSALAQKPRGAGSISENYTIAKCIEVLESIEGVDMATYLKAVEKFQEKSWRETFIEMSDFRRQGWLACLL